MDDIKQQMAEIDHAAINNVKAKSGRKRWIYFNGPDGSTVRLTEAEWNAYRKEHFPTIGMRIIMGMPTW